MVSNKKQKNMWKKASVFILTVFVGVAFTSCNNSSEKSAEEQSKSERKEQLKDLKQEMKDVGDAIGDLFRDEKDNFKESATEVVDDLNRKIDSYKDRLSTA